MNMKDLMAFEKAADDTVAVVEKFYDRYMTLSDEDTNKIQEYIKTISKEDISLFVNQFESIKRCVGRLDQLLTCMINNEPLE